jgi:hypothetical protein
VTNKRLDLADRLPVAQHLDMTDSVQFGCLNAKRS